MSTVLRALAIALVLTALPVAATVWLTGGGDDGAKEPAPSATPAPYSPTPLADYDTSTVTVARAGFCERVQPEAIAEALGSEPKRSTDYGNGDEVEVVPGEKDVAHEYGCVYDARDGTEARAWVFVPPVTADRAADLVKATEQIPGCTQERADAYGDPSVALVCTYRESTIASYRGLFGDAWLTCSLTIPEGRSAADRPSAATLLDRTGRWCVAAAEAASVS